MRATLSSEGKINIDMWTVRLGSLHMFCISLKINPLETSISTYTTRLAPLSRQLSCVLSQAQQDVYYLQFFLWKQMYEIKQNTEILSLLSNYHWMAHGVGIVPFTIILLKTGFLVCLRQFQWHGVQSILGLQLGRIGIL